MATATLTWTANPSSEGVTNYRIFRSLGGSAFVPLVTLGIVLTYTDTTVPNVSQAVAYSLTALDQAGNESARSAVVSKVVDVTPPSAPVGLDVVLG